MSSNSQIIGGRRVSVPVREREQDAFRYFRVDSAALNVARSDGKRISFVKGWYKTKNVGDISYLLELIDEGQIGIWEHVEQSAEMDFTNTLSGSVAQLEQIEAQIAADPRFAAAIAQMVAATKGKAEVAEQLEQAANAALANKTSHSETSGLALKGMGNSQALAVGASISQSEVEKAEVATATKIASGAALGNTPAATK
jgi:hypothetical protein